MTAVAIAVGILVAGGVVLILLPGLVRITIGFILLGHAVNIVLIAAGGLGRREPPLLGQADPAQMADPLPQALALTAIVISFGVTVYLLGLARATRAAEPGSESGCESDREPATGPGPGSGSGRAAPTAGSDTRPGTDSGTAGGEPVR